MGLGKIEIIKSNNMREVITKNKIKNVIGNWIVQLNDYQEGFKLTESKNIGFWLEKRISFVGCIYGTDALPYFKPDYGQQLIILNGLYYCHGVYTHDDFVKYFNEGAPVYSGETREKGKGRFHRLLTTKEVDWLTEQIKSKL